MAPFFQFLVEYRDADCDFTRPNAFVLSVGQYNRFGTTSGKASFRGGIQGEPKHRPGATSHADTVHRQGIQNYLYIRAYFSDVTLTTATEPLLASVLTDRRDTVIAEQTVSG